MNKIKIGTHNGKFHCDEVLACVMLKNYTTQFKNASIIRSRDPKVLDQCDIVVDVGGKYDPPRLLDHHQIQFQNTYPHFQVRLSSAGLVYFHFGEQIISNIIREVLQKQKSKLTFEPKYDHQIINYVKKNIYESLIIYIDASDNGISKIENKEVNGVPTTLWRRVGKLNPMWWEQNTDEDQRFRKAMDIAEEELVSEVKGCFLGSLQTNCIFREYFMKRNDIHPSGKVIQLDKYVPWEKSLFKLEVEQDCVGQILYVIFPEKNGDSWKIQAVPQKQGAFQLRKGIKAEWRGIKDLIKLRMISEIDDIVFVHANGFIGGAVSRESVIKMAELSL